MECQKCGNPKEKHEKYDTSKNLTSPKVTDPELLRMANAGENWECQYCKGSVRNLLGECNICGGPKTKAAETPKHFKIFENMDIWDKHVSNKEEPKKETPIEPNEPERVFIPNTGGLREPPKSYIKPAPPTKRPQVQVNHYYDPDDDKKLIDKIRGWRPVFRVWHAVVLGVIGIVALSVWAFIPHQEHVVVNDTHWVYTAHLQQRQLNHGTDWDGNMPSGAFNVSCVTRQHGTENCHPHDCMCHNVTDYCSEQCNCRESCRTSCSDNGNGFSSCSESCTTICSTCRTACGSHEECSTCYDQCPVYDEWCNFDYYTWPTINTQRTQGREHTVQEPTLRLQENPPAPQRIVREHSYSVIFTNEEGETWEYEPETKSDYDRFYIGENWIIEVNHAGSVQPRWLDGQPDR